MPSCLIGLGSNLGDRPARLDEALAQLSVHPRIAIAARSRYHQTAPVGGPSGQPAYLNAAALVETSLSPEAMLAELQRVEFALGRRRDARWGPRTIDLDLLLYDQVAMSRAELEIPHPRMVWRRFVLEPAAEVAPDMLHPGTGWTIARLLENLNRTPWYLAIAGPIGVGKSCLAREIARQNGARLLAEEIDSLDLEEFYHNPSSHGGRIELEFLQQRASQLAADRWPWHDDRATVSDFWFEQSPAFARVWLPHDRQDTYFAHYLQLRSQVVRPRLTVLLDSPVEELLARIKSRGRPGEETLSAQRLVEIRESLRQQASLVDQGPVLRLDHREAEAAVAEVRAALEAMK